MLHAKWNSEFGSNVRSFFEGREHVEDQIRSNIQTSKTGEIIKQDDSFNIKNADWKVILNVDWTIAHANSLYQKGVHNWTQRLSKNKFLFFSWQNLLNTMLRPRDKVSSVNCEVSPPKKASSRQLHM